MKNVTHPAKDMKELQDSIGDDHFPTLCLQEQSFCKENARIITNFTVKYFDFNLCLEIGTSI